MLFRERQYLERVQPGPDLRGRFPRRRHWMCSMGWCYLASRRVAAVGDVGSEQTGSKLPGKTASSLLRTAILHGEYQTEIPKKTFERVYRLDPNLSWTADEPIRIACRW
jgi:hypothetical protein